MQEYTRKPHRKRNLAPLPLATAFVWKNLAHSYRGAHPSPLEAPRRDSSKLSAQ